MTKGGAGLVTWSIRERPPGPDPGGSLLAPRGDSGCFLFAAFVDVEAADSLVDRAEDERLVLGEQVAIDVLDGLDPAVAHLIRDLHVARARGDHQ